MHIFSYILVFSALFVLCLTEREFYNLTHALSKCGGEERSAILLDVSKDFIKKAKQLYPNCVENGLECGQKEKSFAFLDVAMNVISEVKKGYPTCPDPECPKCVEKPMDCSDILRSGQNKSGVYTIWPRSRLFSNKSLSVYCDMDTDGGGWTVIQRRGQFSTPKDYFYKDWQSYKTGFGNLTEEFWIGNDNIYAISNQALYKIRFDLKDHVNTTGFAEYSTFWIDDEATNYKLHIQDYKGNVGDSMSYHDQMQFSTKDRDNDKWSESCAVKYQGAWWYKSCEHATLNGLNQPGIDSEKSFHWYHWMKNMKGLSGVEMKLRS